MPLVLGSVVELTLQAGDDISSKLLREVVDIESCGESSVYLMISPVGVVIVSQLEHFLL